MAESSSSKPKAGGSRMPAFIKVQDLRPGTSGLNLIVKVVDTKMIVQRGRHQRIAESLVADKTAMIVFTARNDQVNLMKEGSTLIMRNAKIDLFKGSMRLVVDKNGGIEVTEPASFTIKEDNNMSLIEYEVIRVAI